MQFLAEINVSNVTTMEKKIINSLWIEEVFENMNYRSMASICRGDMGIFLQFLFIL